MTWPREEEEDPVARKIRATVTRWGIPAIVASATQSLFGNTILQIASRFDFWVGILIGGTITGVLSVLAYFKFVRTPEMGSETDQTQTKSHTETSGTEDEQRDHVQSSSPGRQTEDHKMDSGQTEQQGEKPDEIPQPRQEPSGQRQGGQPGGSQPGTGGQRGQPRQGGQIPGRHRGTAQRHPSTDTNGSGVHTRVAITVGEFLTRGILAGLIVFLIVAGIIVLSGQFLGPSAVGVASIVFVGAVFVIRRSAEWLAAEIVEKRRTQRR